MTVRTLRGLAIVGLAIILTSGCSFNDYHTFASTRKLLESDAPAATKVGFGPIVAVQETFSTPVTIYLDAAKYAERNEDVYLSYLGMQTILDSPMHGVYKALASLVIVPVDSVWFPVAGTIDTVRVINKDGTETVTRSASVVPETVAPERDAHPSRDSVPSQRVGRGW